MSDIVAPSAETEHGASPKSEQTKGTASEKASEVRQEASSAVADVKDEASAQLGTVKEEVTGQAHDLVHQARRHAVRQADDGTQRFGGAFRSAGSELVDMADRSDRESPVTNAVRKIGERATTMGDRYQQGGYRALSDDVARFARRSPGMFLLAAVGAGFVVGRIVRNADTKAIADAARPDDGSGNGFGAGQPSGPAVSFSAGDMDPSIGSAGAGGMDPSNRSVGGFTAEVPS